MHSAKPRYEGDRIGTTKRGIGPAYAYKAARTGIRAGDLLRPDYLRARLEGTIEQRNRQLVEHDRPAIQLDELLDLCASWREAIGERIIDTLPLVKRAVTEGHRVLLEGQLGVMRDLDWGIYPYVTSSNPAVGAASCGAGIPPTAIDEVLGVVKAYQRLWAEDLSRVSFLEMKARTYVNSVMSTVRPQGDQALRLVRWCCDSACRVVERLHSFGCD